MSKDKIGSSVLKKDHFIPPEIKVDKLFTTHQLKRVYRERILRLLNLAERPLNISEIQRSCGIKTWTTAKHALIDLEAQGKVEHFRSGPMLLFRIKRG